MISQDDPRPRPLGASPQIFRPDQVAAWTGKFGPLVRSFQTHDLSPEDLRGVLAQLAGLGAALIEQLMPPTLVEAVSRLPDDSIIAIESDADWVPWELLACDPGGDPGGDLWGERFIVVRTPLIGAPVSASPAPEAAGRLSRALLVVGDAITSKPEALPQLIFGAMAGRARPPLVEGSLDDLRRQARTVDIIHFACHGGGWPNSLSFGPGPGRKLVPMQAATLGLRHGTIVFANACESASADLILAGFQSFGQRFYLAGARPFIGTLGPVPEQEAVEFASLFYEAFAVRGLTAGQAMRDAKAEARRRFKVPIWLFYCLYGSEAASRSWAVGM